MPDETTSTATAVPPTADSTTADAATADAAVEIDWKAKSREWEKRAKDNLAQISELRPKADQFAALEEASKSEAQRLVEQAETATRAAETARAEAIRYKAAATYGIGADHFDLLGSGTEEEISARAEKIAALVAIQATTQTPATPPSSRPVEQLRAGATPAGTESEEDVILAKLFGPPQ